MNLFAGSYTQMIAPDFGGHGDGLYSMEFDPINGNIKVVSTRHLVNPSYLTVINDNLYTFNEVSLDEEPFLYAFKVGENQILKFINKVPVDGAYACHINYSQKYACLFVSCYGGGNVLAFPVGTDGSVKPALYNIMHEGSSINTDRQEAPHVHYIAVDDESDRIFVSDLGIDKIMIYELKNQNNEISISYKESILIPEGSGPRHLIIHPGKKYLFALTELSAEVMLIDISTKKVITSVKLISDSGIIPGAAAIKISGDGKHIYASERSTNQIFVLKFDEYNKSLELIQSVETHVITPRDFMLDSSGNWLIVAGQDSDSLAVFERNPFSGTVAFHKMFENFNSISCII